MLKRIFTARLTLIVLISLAMKLIFFCYLSPWNSQVEGEKAAGSDSWGYEQMAENLLKYHSYNMPADTFNISNYSEYKLTSYLFFYRYKTVSRSFFSNIA